MILSMRTVDIIVFMLAINLTSGRAGAQNLVPNPSFEDTVSCPSSTNQVSNSIGWTSFGTGTNSPDYFHDCAPPPIVNTSINIFGSQVPATGQAYVGFLSYHEFYQERISCVLLDTLEIGQCYELSAKVSFGDDPTYANFASNSFGFLFLTDSFPMSAYSSPNFAHYRDTLVVTDRLNWTTIAGTFTADSNYTRLVLGMMFDVANSDTVVVSGSGTESYYFLDDIRVELCSTVGTLNTLEDPNISIYPNPFSNNFTITGLPASYDLTIYNVLGQIIFEQRDQQEHSKEISTRGWEDGITLIRLNTIDKVLHYKVIKQ